MPITGGPRKPRMRPACRNLIVLCIQFGQHRESHVRTASDQSSMLRQPEFSILWRHASCHRMLSCGFEEMRSDPRVAELTGLAPAYRFQEPSGSCSSGTCSVPIVSNADARHASPRCSDSLVRSRPCGHRLRRGQRRGRAFLSEVMICIFQRGWRCVSISSTRTTAWASSRSE